MGNYYVLEDHQTKGGHRATPTWIDDTCPASLMTWISGKPLEAPPTDILAMEWDDQDGLRATFYSGNCLMRKELVEALQEFGIEHLETFENTIRERQRGGISRDYLAVNITSSIEAADMEASETIQILGPAFPPDFESLVIDEDKASGHHFFRLRECLTAIIVSEALAEHLKAKGGFGLTFLDPEEFCG